MYEKKCNQILDLTQNTMIQNSSQNSFLPIVSAAYSTQLISNQRISEIFSLWRHTSLTHPKFPSTLNHSSRSIMI